MAANGFVSMPIELGHALRAATLPRIHGDPFDRMLVAQAQLERLPILTADPAITRYDVETIWNAPGPRPTPEETTLLNPAASYAKRLERYRPGLVPFVLDGLASIYGHPVWERRQDPTSELILTILTQNSADVNAEVAFEALRRRIRPGSRRSARPRGGLGRGRADGGCTAGLGTGRVRATPRTDRRDPARRPRQPEGAAPPGNPAQDPRGTRRLLPRMPRRDAGARGADWLTQIDGIGKRPPRCCRCSASTRRCCRSTATSNA